MTVVDGTPVRTDLNRDTRGPGTDGDGRSEGPTGGRGDRAGAGPESTHTTDGLPTTQGSGALAQVVSTCGMGDIIVRGRYYVLDERGWLPDDRRSRALQSADGERRRGPRYGAAR